MPLGGQAHGTATGPAIGPRTVDGRAAAAAGLAAGPAGAGAFSLPLSAEWAEDLAAGAGLQCHTGPCTLHGWSALAGGGEAGLGVAVIFDGTAITDPVVGLAVGGLAVWLGTGVAIHRGLYLAWPDPDAPPIGALYFD